MIFTGQDNKTVFVAPIYQGSNPSIWFEVLDGVTGIHITLTGRTIDIILQAIKTNTALEVVDDQNATLRIEDTKEGSTLFETSVVGEDVYHKCTVSRETAIKIKEYIDELLRK